VLEDYNCPGMSLEILLRHIDFKFYSHGCREQNLPRNIFSRGYILDNGDLCSRSIGFPWHARVGTLTDID
jgi:hypothetical protein